MSFLLISSLSISITEDVAMSENDDKSILSCTAYIIEIRAGTKLEIYIRTFANKIFEASVLVCFLVFMFKFYLSNPIL